MTRNATRQEQQPAIEPVDEAVDHVRGPASGHLILEYGDYECPYSRQAFRAIERVEEELARGVRFAFRHFPLTGIHPHALAAAAAAEAAALQGRFWDMHGLLFHRQKALQDGDLRRYAAGLRLDLAQFDRDRAGAVLERVRRDMQSGIASGEVRGTPTLFIDGVVHRGGYDTAVFGTLASTLCTVTGITNKSLRALMTGLLGGSTYSMNQASYDLARLARNGLITRVPRRNRYALTPDGLRFAVFYTKVHDRVLRPLMAADQPPAPPPLRTALRVIDKEITQRLAAARLPAAA
jgi:predicted DsbA family dithiol-disulfide isomerase